LVFGVLGKIFKVFGGFAAEIESRGEFVSFLTPHFTVLDRVSVVGSPVFESPIRLFTENSEGRFAALCENGSFFVENELKSRSVHSFLFSHDLLSYIEGGIRHHIFYRGEHESREVEPRAELLFFRSNLYSIVMQMNRGNLETVAPHSIVISALRELLQENNYTQSVKILKRYQVTFSRFIGLGEHSLPALCAQIGDIELRQFLSGLKPFADESDLRFLVDFLSFVLNSPFGFDIATKAIDFPTIDPEFELTRDFRTTICTCLVLLESTVTAVFFACQFGTPDAVKSALSFLLTLYDANELFDISLRTYDTRCIASVGFVTMREPASYVPFVEELNQTANPHLQRALINEQLSDGQGAVIEYAQCGPEFEDRCFAIICRDNLHDVGLDCFGRDSEMWRRIVNAKLALLEKSGKEKDAKSAALTALSTDDGPTIARFAKQIVQAGLWRLAIPKVSESDLPALKAALVAAKQFENAAYLCHHYLGDKTAASELVVKAHQWTTALECGADQAEVVEGAFQVLREELFRKQKEAEGLKRRFEEVQERQSQHSDPSARKGKNKDKRGLPAMVAKLADLAPGEEETAEFEMIVGMLPPERANELTGLFRGLCRAVFPLPVLPTGEQLLPPDHLEGFV
jgi:elongator complex protein 1